MNSQERKKDHPPSYLRTPDFESYTIDDWRDYIDITLESAAVREFGRILEEEIGRLPRSEMRARFWRAWLDTPCAVGNGYAEILEKLSAQHEDISG